MLVTYIVTIHCDECQYTNIEMFHNVEPTKKKLMYYIHRKQCNTCWGKYLNRNQP